jgi:hypothetical protein
MDKKLELRLLAGRLCICRLGPGEAVPDWAERGEFFSVTRTSEELSIVCDEGNVPEGITCAGGYAALKVTGPLDFSLIGILSSLSSVLAGANVSIFALSTYDTDYILFRESDKQAAFEALRSAGYILHQ